MRRREGGFRNIDPPAHRVPRPAAGQGRCAGVGPGASFVQSVAATRDPGRPVELAGASLAEDITTILLHARAGERDALDRLFPLVYDELRAVARRRLAAERRDHTLNTTALVHEAYVKLVDQTRVAWRDRAHFFAVAARAMRRILLDHARRHATAKRGGGRRRVPLDAAGLSMSERADALIDLDEALERLNDLEPRLADVVECRFFGGLTEEETAAALNVTSRTVRRDWAKARALLYAWLEPEEGAAS